MSLQLWLKQPIWNALNKEQRQNYIPEFTHSLTQFMKKNGYIMDSSWNPCLVAKWLHAIHANQYHSFTYAYPRHRAWPEDEDQFYHIITTDSLQSFLETWSDNEDMNLDTRVGNRVLHELHQFLWTYIDLENSKQGNLVAIRLEESDSDSENDVKKVDHYIREANLGYHGGNWSKV